LIKIVDFSFQFTITNNGEPEYLGYSFFETNTNGQYKSTFIHPENGKSEIAEIIRKTTSFINITAERLKTALKHSVYAKYHRGFLGIDAMIYRDENSLKIQPCIEINSRMTMGILTMFIEKRVHQGVTGKYMLFYGQPGEFHRFAHEESNLNPSKIRNGEISSGFLSLVEPDAEKKFGAYIIVGNCKGD
jgi:hypothetical protein